MTTPQVPANPLDASDISDEINPAGYVQGQQTIGSNNVVRKLSGTFEKARSNTVELSFSDLSNKTAFSEILAASTSNTQNGVGTALNPLTSLLTLTANTDMVEPVINWSYEFLPGSTATASDIAVTRNIVVDPQTNRPSSKSANITLSTASSNLHANLRVTAVMTVPNYDAAGLQEIGTHTVNTCTKDIKLTVGIVNAAFQVTATPSFTVNATGTVAQTATITVKASSNTEISGTTTYKFIPTFVSGTKQLPPSIGVDTAVFTATAPQTGIINTAVYSLRTEYYVNNILIDSNTSTVDIQARFIDRKVTSLTPSATTNNQFSNASSQYSTIDITAVHNAVAPTYTQGTITFTYEVNGSAITSQEISSNSSTKVERISLYHDYSTDGFGFKKAVVTAIATLRTPSGEIMDQKRITGLTLRAGAYGLDIKSPTSVTESGYAAQTAISSGSATWGAQQATFAWTSRQFNGSGPVLSVDDSSQTSTINITATTPTGKNKSQTISNTCNYDITGTLKYDGVTIKTVTLSDILIKAESLPYTFALTTAGQSNVQVEVTSGTTSSILVTGSASVGTITWSKDNAGVGISTTSSTANVFVTSSSGGSSNAASVVVTGELRDGSSRVIESLQTQSISLDATTTNLTIVGENASLTTDERTATATGIFESSASFGTHSLRFPPVKQSGSDLELVRDSNQRIRILATATQSTKTGTYRITGEVTYKGITKITTKDVTVAVSALAPTLTATKTPYQYNSYIPFGGINFGIGGVTGGTSQTYVLIKGEDIVVESNYPGTINTDYTIRRVVNYLPNFNGTETVTLTGPFYNEAANTNPAPDGHPASSNKRRDRVQLVPFLGILLDYDITYELYDAAGTFIRDLRVTSSGITIPKPGANTTLKFDNISGKTFSFTNKSNNIYGYPEPHPQLVEYQERADYTASYVTESDIPTPRFSFSTVKSNPLANVTLTKNEVNGQANVLVKSVYLDNSSGFSGLLPTVTTSTGTVDLSVQLTSEDSGTNYNIGLPATQSRNFELPMPPGRCYRLSTFSTYGVRMRHTQDVFGNSSERIDYGRVPNISTLNGPETKFVGFHTSSLRYPLDSGPIYGSDSAQTRYYSSDAHKSAWIAAYSGEASRPSKVIPQDYFVVMSFDPDGPQYLAQVTLIGSDNKTYVLPLWATGRGGTRASNDNFGFSIYQWSPPSGVTVSYAFLSNQGTSAPPPPPPPGGLTFIKSDPGGFKVGDNVFVNIGTVSGGFITETFTGPIDEGLE